ncbi:MAG: hypothetical protein HZB85_00220 [Deltaproteobacteria bacterium]|nr:hypothetical protein [Deltaproteobacteria bacterium]
MNLSAIIEELGELANDGAPLTNRLQRACALLLETAPFDQCAIYLWDSVNRAFVLNASVGTGSAAIETYGEDEGLPGRVKASGKGLAASKKDLSGTAIDGLIDAGMRGFSYALTLALRDSSALYGVIYLKAVKKTRRNAARDSALTTAAALIVSIIRGEEINARHRRKSAELAELQARLINSEKVMALADMASNIVHEIKNPLLSIGGLANRLKKHVPQDAPGRLYLDQITHETVRLEKLIGGIIRCLHESALELQSDDMNDIVSESIELFREDAMRRGVNIVKKFTDNRLPVRADREQMKIAFDNLIANALQSMENSGTLTVSTCLDNDSIVVKVADSGGGIDPRYENYIFNPFFTTKKFGTGLGLPIANAIVMRHKGVIEVDNNIGVGVTFTVKLCSEGIECGLRA